MLMFCEQDIDSLVPDDDGKKHRRKSRKPKFDPNLSIGRLLYHPMHNLEAYTCTEQRLDVATAELDYVQKEIDETKTRSTKMIDTIAVREHLRCERCIKSIPGCA